MNLLLVYLLWFAGSFGTFWLSVCLNARLWRRVNRENLVLKDLPAKLGQSIVYCAVQALAGMYLVSNSPVLGVIILDVMLFVVIVNPGLAMIAQNMIQLEEDEREDLEWVGITQTGIGMIVLWMALVVF